MFKGFKTKNCKNFNNFQKGANLCWCDLGGYCQELVFSHKPVFVLHFQGGYWCILKFLYWCILKLLYWCILKLLYYCIFILILMHFESGYWCIIIIPEKYMHISTNKFNCIARTPLSIIKPSQWDIFHQKFDFIHHYNFRLYIRETLSIRSKVFIALTATGSDPGSLASFSRSWITLSKDIGIGNSTGLDALCFVEKLKIVFNIF